jgi:hypothetical protein
MFVRCALLVKEERRKKLLQHTFGLDSLMLFSRLSTPPPFSLTRQHTHTQKSEIKIFKLNLMSGEKREKG